MRGTCATLLIALVFSLSLRAGDVGYQWTTFLLSEPFCV